MHVEASLMTRPAIFEIPPYLFVMISSLSASVPIDRQTADPCTCMTHDQKLCLNQQGGMKYEGRRRDHGFSSINPLFSMD
jgi:hypothetical protein